LHHRGPRGRDHVKGARRWIHRGFTAVSTTTNSDVPVAVLAAS
jgi:hypothetical protein